MNTEANQILRNNDEVCIPSLSTILLAVSISHFSNQKYQIG